MGCHFLLQGIFPTQGSNLGLPNCRQILYHLSQEQPNSPEHSPESWRWCLEHWDLSSNLSPAPVMCGCRQVPFPLRASVFSPVTWDWSSYLTSLDCGEDLRPWWVFTEYLVCDGHWVHSVKRRHTVPTCQGHPGSQECQECEGSSGLGHAIHECLWLLLLWIEKVITISFSLLGTKSATGIVFPFCGFKEGSLRLGTEWWTWGSDRKKSYPCWPVWMGETALVLN